MNVRIVEMPLDRAHLLLNIRDVTLANHSPHPSGVTCSLSLMPTISILERALSIALTVRKCSNVMCEDNLPAVVFP